MDWRAPLLGADLSLPSNLAAIPNDRRAAGRESHGGGQQLVSVAQRDRRHGSRQAVFVGTAVTLVFPEGDAHTSSGIPWSLPSRAFPFPRLKHCSGPHCRYERSGESATPGLKRPVKRFALASDRIVRLSSSGRCAYSGVRWPGMRILTSVAGAMRVTASANARAGATGSTPR